MCPTIRASSTPREVRRGRGGREGGLCVYVSHHQGIIRTRRGEGGVRGEGREGCVCVCPTIRASWIPREIRGGRGGEEGGGEGCVCVCPTARTLWTPRDVSEISAVW